MIEVVYKDEKQRAKGNEGIFQLPRNVRQIGMTDQNYRIYMEDYVYTFLERAAAAGEDKEEKNATGCFYGGDEMGCRDRLSFYQRCSACFGEEISQEHVELTDAMWQQIHEDAEKYFEGEEIVGGFWVAGCSDGSIGNASSYTPQAFRRRKSADADGSVGQRRSFFSL